MDLTKAFDTISRDLLIALLLFTVFKGVIKTNKWLFK